MPPPAPSSLRYRVAALRDDHEVGHCFVEADRPDAAKAIGRFDLAERLRFNVFDIAYRYTVTTAAIADSE